MIHNLSSRSQSDFSVNVITSDIPAGTYDLVNALDETVVGNLVVGSQGGFSTTFSELTLPFLVLYVCGFNSNLTPASLRKRHKKTLHLEGFLCG